MGNVIQHSLKINKILTWHPLWVSFFLPTFAVLKLKRMKKLLFLFLMIPFLGISQVGINTQTPTETLDVNGSLRVRDVQEGSLTDSILVVNEDGVVRKISLSILIQDTSKCPNLVRNASNGYYLLFESDNSVNKPNDAITIGESRFISAGTWIEGNKYYFSYTKVVGNPINLDNFTVDFNGQTCKYKK